MIEVNLSHDRTDFFIASGAKLWKCMDCRHGYVVTNMKNAKKDFVCRDRHGNVVNDEERDRRGDCTGRHDNSDRRMCVYAYVTGPGTRALGYYMGWIDTEDD